jgi:hypothetical protein
MAPVLQVVAKILKQKRCDVIDVAAVVNLASGLNVPATELQL